MSLIVFFYSMDRDGQNGRAAADDTVAALEGAAAGMTEGGYIRLVDEESFKLTALGRAVVSKWNYENLMALIEEAGGCTCKSEKDVANA